MIRRIVFFAALAVTLASPGLAQQPSPIEQALSQRLGIEINAGVQAAAAIIDLQRQLSATQARIKALEEKYEPKKDAEPAK